MTEKKLEFANNIWVKKFPSKTMGDWISVSIKKENGEYHSYKFFPQKQQKKPNVYTEYYGVVDDWKPVKKEENITNAEQIGDDSIPF